MLYWRPYDTERAALGIMMVADVQAQSMPQATSNQYTGSAMVVCHVNQYYIAGTVCADGLAWAGARISNDVWV